MKKSSIVYGAVALSVSIVLLVLWITRKPDSLETALKLAGPNRTELEIVMNHYSINKADSLKLKAAHYLIENMPGHFSYDSTHIHEYRSAIEKINSLRKGDFSNEVISEQVNPLMDSLIRIYPLSNVYSKTENDLTSIKSGLLTNTIEQAFESYDHNPFKDSILFDDFLEYVLPYRVQNGYCLEDWRSYFTQNYSLKTGQEFSSVHQFCDSLLYNFKDIKIGWPITDKFPYIKLTDYLKSKLTNCPQKCWFNCLLLRSFGIPTAIDFVPACRVHDRGHEWNIIKLKDGLYPFDPFWEGFGGMQYLKASYERIKIHPAIGPIQFPKIYRKTYKMNISELLNHAIHSDEEIPPFFQNFFLKDVTNEYFKTFTIESPIVRNIKSIGYAYACVLGPDQVWVPVDFGEIKKGKITFHSMGSENVYLPSFYEIGNTIPAAYPILLNDNGSTSILSPDTVHARNIEISHVAYPKPELKEYKEAFIGATVEGSNYKNFEKSEILYQINELCEPGTYHIPINSISKYRYFRFTIPKAKCKLNEIKFFIKKNGIENEVNGELISSNPKDNLLFQKIIDGDLITGTYFTELRETHKNSDKIWIGYDFKVPASISAFEFYFVFGANIRKEGIYELLYWDFEWKSLGVKKSNSTSPVIFDHVPENALLMIKIHDTDKYSRPFTYSDRKQHWW